MLFSMNAQDLLDGLNTVTRALAARPSKQILRRRIIGCKRGQHYAAVYGRQSVY